MNRRLTFVTVTAVGAALSASLVGSHVVAQAATPATGFSQPYAGTPKYQQYAPTEATSARQINRLLSSKAADRIARKLGLNKAHAFTAKQYALFISGKGVGGDKKDAEPRRRIAFASSRTRQADPSTPTSTAR